MGILLGLLAVYAILLVTLIALSVGIAFLLHWLIPAVGLDMLLLVAVIAVGQTMLIFGRVIGTLPLPIDEFEGNQEPPIVIMDREVALPRRRRKRT